MASRCTHAPPWKTRITYQDERRVFAIKSVALVDLGHGGVHAVGSGGFRHVWDVYAEKLVVLDGWHVVSKYERR